MKKWGLRANRKSIFFHRLFKANQTVYYIQGTFKKLENEIHKNNQRKRADKDQILKFKICL